MQLECDVNYEIINKIGFKLIVIIALIVYNLLYTNYIQSVVLVNCY